MSDTFVVGFIGSSGGHLEQLLSLKQLITRYDSFMVTESTGYKLNLPVRSYELFQVNRRELSSILKFPVNSVRSLFIYLRERPDVVVTTGALATIPFCMLSKMFGAKLVYIESFAKADSPTLTGRFLYNHADRFYVQWESMLDIYPNARYVGGIY